MRISLFYHSFDLTDICIVFHVNSVSLHYPLSVVSIINIGHWTKWRNCITIMSITDVVMLTMDHLIWKHLGFLSSSPSCDYAYVSVCRLGEMSWEAPVCWQGPALQGNTDTDTFPGYSRTAGHSLLSAVSMFYGIPMQLSNKMNADAEEIWHVAWGFWLQMWI